MVISLETLIYCSSLLSQVVKRLPTPQRRVARYLQWSKHNQTCLTPAFS